MTLSCMFQVRNRKELRPTHGRESRFHPCKGSRKRGRWTFVSETTGLSTFLLGSTSFSLKYCVSL